MLVEQIASPSFKPEQYEDDFKKQVRDLIEQKVQGQEITAPAAEAPKAQIIDLMAALKASLAAAADGTEARKPPRPSPRKPAAAEEEDEAPSAKITPIRKRAARG